MVVGGLLYSFHLVVGMRRIYPSCPYRYQHLEKPSIKCQAYECPVGYYPSGIGLKSKPTEIKKDGCKPCPAGKYLGAKDRSAGCYQCITCECGMYSGPNAVSTYAIPHPPRRDCPFSLPLAEDTTSSRSLPPPTPFSIRESLALYFFTHSPKTRLLLPLN